MYVHIYSEMAMRHCGISGAYLLHIDRSPAILTSDDFIRSNEIIRTKWLIYVVISHFVLTI